MLNEINGDIFLKRIIEPNCYIVITTNGSINKNNEAVMGRGIALRASQIFKNIKKELADQIFESGNKVYKFDQYRIFTFPVKHKWFEEASRSLIQKSCQQLIMLLNETKIDTIYIPHAGCSNGRLNWLKDVKPIFEQEFNNDARINVISSVSSNG